MHIPVLLQEVLQFLDPQPGEKYLDATVGGGGHTAAILEKGGVVLGLDRDGQAIARLQELYQTPIRSHRLLLAQANFADLAAVVQAREFDQLAGILFDLGLSSDQLDDASRGFAFQKDGPLDMRFDQSQKLTAHEIVNFYPEEALVRTFQTLGEEWKFAKKVARGIVEVRKQRTLESTTELFELIKKTLPASLRFRAGDTARRIFMALRIAVNEELQSLERILPQALALLKPGGRLVGISFHSLEDRIVKNFLAKEARDCLCPPEFPVCRCGHLASLRILTKKPVTAAAEEIKINPRAHSAKLRAAEKI